MEFKRGITKGRQPLIEVDFIKFIRYEIRFLWSLSWPGNGGRLIDDFIIFERNES
jgi:hypothetical protein